MGVGLPQQPEALEPKWIKKGWAAEEETGQQSFGTEPWSTSLEEVGREEKCGILP